MKILLPLLTKIQTFARSQQANCGKDECPPKKWGKPSLRQNGYSLAAVMILGAVTSMWVGALMATLVPTYERMTLIQGRNMARCSAEAGLDYVVGDLNAKIASADNGSTTSAYDSSTSGTTTYSKLTQSLIGNVGSNVVVGVTNYSPQSNCTLYQSTLPTSPNPWRIIDSYAAIGSYYKHIRLILEPIVVYNTVPNQVTTQNPTPSFPFALFGNIQVDSIGKVTIESYNNPAGNYTQWNADTGSNQTVNELNQGNNMSRGVIEGGNHIELATPAQTHPPGSTVNFNNGMSGTVVSSAPWMQVGNNVYSNNNTDGYNPGLSPQAPSLPSSPNQYNVLGMNNLPNPNPAGGTVTTYQSYGNANIPPAPTAPTGTFVQASGGKPGSGSANVGSISLSGSAKIVISDSVTSVPTSLSASSGTLTIPPGNYVVNGITLNGTSSIVNNSSSPTQIYIQGSVPGTTAVSISNTASINMNGSANGTAANMQIYYNGSKDVDLDGQISAVVYAPNAVNFYIGQGLTNATKFYGAVVGGNIYLNGGLTSGGGVQFNYDYSLKPGNSLGGQLGGGSVMTYGTTTTTTTTTTLEITGFKGVSWYEVHDGPHFSPTQWSTWPTQVNSLLGL